METNISHRMLFGTQTPTVPLLFLERSASTAFLNQVQPADGDMLLVLLSRKDGYALPCQFTAPEAFCHQCCFEGRKAWPRNSDNASIDSRLRCRYAEACFPPP